MVKYDYVLNKKRGWPYKVAMCITCERRVITPNQGHSGLCCGNHLKKVAELPTMPVVMLVDGKWNLSNLGIEEPKREDFPKSELDERRTKFGKARHAYIKLREHVICALIPSVADREPEKICVDGTKEMFQMKILQIVTDSCDPKTLPLRKRVSKVAITEEIRNEARSYVFSQEFAQIVDFIGLDVYVIRDSLIRRWAGLEKKVIEIDEDELVEA